MSKLFSKLYKVVTPFNTQQVRWLPRWSHRRPVRVIAAEEYDKDQDQHNITVEKEKAGNYSEFKTKINWKQPNRKSSAVADEEINEEQIYSKEKVKKTKFIRPLTISTAQKVTDKTTPKTVDMLETIIDGDGNFVYTKMSNNDSRISTILVQIKSKKEKEKKDLILLEGKRLIKDALDAGCKLEYILFSRLNDLEYLKPFLPKLGAKLYKMPYREMQMWSDLTTNPGLMGVFKIPGTEIVNTANTYNLPLTVICDNIREPNNLGSILRTCVGVGCKEVILTKGCVNVWETKVLRSAMGAHFKLRIQRKLNWNDIREKIHPSSAIYIADNQVVSTNTDTSDGDNLGNLLQSVPVVPYYGVDFGRDRDVILIIGGETEGISEDSYKLAFDFKGIRLNVPLSNNIDSLNTGTALGVIAFEIKRQLSRFIEERKESNG